MMKYNKEDFQEILKSFPELQYDEESNRVIGKINFCSKYVLIENGVWDIVQTTEEHSDSFSGEYSIVIDLNKQLPHPQVREASGKIIKVADRLKMAPIDLHVNHDGSLCLDFETTRFHSPVSLSAFILKKVYPFFAWQAYYETYGKKPPCGDHPHDGTDLAAFAKKVKSRGVNEECLCGSGKKYKRCCKRRHEDYLYRISKM